MKRSGLVILASVGAAVSAQSQPARDAAHQPPAFVQVAGAMEFSGRLIVKPLQFETLAARGLKQPQIEAATRQAEATLAAYQEHWYEPLVDHHVIIIPEGQTENSLAAKLMATGLFEFAEPDWTLYPIVTCTSDTKLNSQWHHNDDRMASCDAWDIHTGTAAVTVGICDTGVQTNHPDLLLNRKEGYNAVNKVWENSGGQVGAVHPHGTMTTGCAAANGDNGLGVSGTAWNLSHRMLRVSNSSSGTANLSTLTHAALTSIQAGDKVANVSYSGVNSSSVRSTATQIKNLGGLLTWSAGNDGATLNWGDRDADDVIVVGATTRSDTKSSFSAKGRSVDLMAPGSAVYTTNTNSGYGAVDGTSFSAPLTAGLIGLVWSFNPSLTPDEVEAIIKDACDDLGAAGVDDTYGYGRINSLNSLVLAGGVQGGNTAVPFLEEFPSTTPDEVVWKTINGAEINGDAANEPSEPYALNLDGADTAESFNFLMGSAAFPTYISFFTQHQGVESGKQLAAEYLNLSGDWTALTTVTSNGADQNSFTFFQAQAPFDGYHDDFAIRFRALGADASDDWHIDDIRIGDEFTPPDDCVADFNDDGNVNTQDVLAFLNAWSAGDSSADINNDGSVNTQDVLAYLNLWNAGC
ncbi:MAG: S8 family serine peptidase [Phycisphaerales bacterium]|nr:S8 family serine peptidase [Phycisphaerales bacterium]